MATLTPTCLQDLTTIAIARHARWDPLGLMTVRSHVRESLASIGPVEEHRFISNSEDGVNFILKLPGRQPTLKPLLVGAHYDGPLHSIGADDLSLIHI